MLMNSKLCFNKLHPFFFVNNSPKSQPICNNFWYITSYGNLLTLPVNCCRTIPWAVQRSDF